MPAAITVITVTRGRPDTLARAIASVEAQLIQPAPGHLILVDGCPQTAALLQSGAFPLATWVYCARRFGEQDGPARLARLRNAAVERLSTPWAAFLDDDNEFMPDHLGSLLACAEDAGSRAVYSWRTLHYRDGRPYFAQCFPWARAGSDPRQVYAEFARRGVCRPGSAVLRDRADGLDEPDAIRTVDANEWLLSSALLRRLDFHEDHSIADSEHQRFDDGKLLLDLLALGEPIACTRRATVKYYLGGFSNRSVPGSVAARVKEL